MNYTTFYKRENEQFKVSELCLERGKEREEGLIIGDT